MRHLIHVFLVLAICGCAPLTPTPFPAALGPPRDCEEILALEFRALLGRQESNDQIRVKLSEIFDIPPDAIRISTGGLSWSTKGLEGAFVTKPMFAIENYNSGGFEFQERAPSIETVIDCFGTPDSYGAWYFTPASSHGQPILMFDMYYIKQGVMARVVQTGSRNQPPRIDGKNPTQLLRYVNPDSPTTTLDHLTLGISEEYKEKIKPWPGSWDKIEIDIEPAAR